MRIRNLILIFAGLLVAGLAAAAPPHSITYEKKSAAPGTTLIISGNEFTVIRLPIRDFNGTKYAITLPVPSQDGIIFFGDVFTTHSTDPIGANTTIDGFQALVTVSDHRFYSLSADFVTPGTNVFEVNGFAQAIVRIQVGTMVLDLSEFFLSPDPLSSPLAPPETNVNIGAGFNAVSFAEWWKWTDPVTQVNALNLWIDYIRIIAL